MKLSEIKQINTDTMPLFEMANLGSKRTGFNGIVFISTEMTNHGPRVKWFPKQTGREETPCLIVTIEDKPQVKNHHLEAKDVNYRTKHVVDWVLLNKEVLLDFWNNGVLWSEEKVDAFKNSLKPL